VLIGYARVSTDDQDSALQRDGSRAFELRLVRHEHDGAVIGSKLWIENQGGARGIRVRPQYALHKDESIFTV
jgi:DNA invertase Pin-like site-specific DNA recombinase